MTNFHVSFFKWVISHFCWNRFTWYWNANVLLPTLFDIYLSLLPVVLTSLEGRDNLKSMNNICLKNYVKQRGKFYIIPLRLCKSTKKNQLLIFIPMFHKRALWKYYNTVKSERKVNFIRCTIYWQSQ